MTNPAKDDYRGWLTLFKEGDMPEFAACALQLAETAEYEDTVRQDQIENATQRAKSAIKEAADLSTATPAEVAQGILDDIAADAKPQ